jgi:TonB family protein
MTARRGLWRRSAVTEGGQTASGKSLLVAALLLAGMAVADDGERKPVKTVVPVYPEKARSQRVEGDVQVCFVVDRQGRVHRARVRTSTNRVFEKPAIRAARASAYEPVPDDEPVPAIKTCRTFRFRLNPVAVERPGAAEP